MFAQDTTVLCTIFPRNLATLGLIILPLSKSLVIDHVLFIHGTCSKIYERYYTVKREREKRGREGGRGREGRKKERGTCMLTNSGSQVIHHA